MLFRSRNVHQLLYEGKDVTKLFIEALMNQNFVSKTVAQINVEEGKRVPAFYIDEYTAYFGWVFWERLTSWKGRKIFGSVLRNKKGDWHIQISSAKEIIIFANENLKIEMDIEVLSEW